MEEENNPITEKDNNLIKGNENRTSLTDKMRGNPWMVATIILGLFSLTMLFASISGKLTGNVISGSDAGDILLNLYESRGAEGLNISSVKEISGVYEVNFLYQGTEIPIYVTRDGKYAGTLNSVTGSADSGSGNAASQEIPKTDKPSVELYVFTYCPYGLQAEKGIVPVVKLLGNKINFKIRQIGAMHGDYEKVEAERQLCIEKNYPDKFYDYLSTFALDSTIGACRGEDACVLPKIKAIYTKLGIDSAKIDACMKTDGVSLYAAEETNAQTNGVSGSPTLIVNGIVTNSGRDSASYLDTICQAFTEGKVPSECSQQLSSVSPSAGFGASTGSASSSSAVQCAT
ncbi:MAG: hypothetical protein AABX30_02685 [Nanoarchaeota archaeon]